MCIINTIRTYTSRLLALLLLAGGLCAHIQAQETSVQPLRKSTASFTVTDLFVYVSGSPSFLRRLGTANNNSTSNQQAKGGYLGFGAEVTLTNTSCKWFRFNSSLGYKYQVYSKQNIFIASSGVYSHWLTLDVAPAFGWWGLPNFGWGGLVGLNTDVFLASEVRNNDHFSYEGVYRECFNKADLSVYAGIVWQFYGFKLEMRMGAYLIPDMDPKKMAYYNLTETRTNGLFYEFKFYYRIFSTGKL